MSNSLVHKSLELVWDTELHRTRKNGQNTAHASHKNSVSTVTDQKKCLCREQKRKKKCKNIKYKGVLDLIPAKHRINSASDNIDISTILSKSSKTVYETQKHIAAQQDPTDDNIKRLLSLSSYSLKPETAIAATSCKRKV
ncbi:uncharacterized protein LOC105288084 isoform X2 [Ooceraea biroi]|uniref:uncharacterized protein LOC105288084 isoform X2 n=1 Tax=Ooceraea biroi TaxID=2015173 RepID=UPI0005B9C4A1|nr:uncharacterized protein LOC105288084 isoform X2 [Ooceraea biroi]